MLYKIKTKVIGLEEKTRVVRYQKTTEIDSATNKPVYEVVTENLGWFVTFEHSHESLYLGDEKPKTEVGKSATIYVEL